MLLLNSQLSSDVFFFPSHSEHHPKPFIRCWTYTISPLSASLMLSPTCHSPFSSLSQFQACNPHCSFLKDAPDSRDFTLLFPLPAFSPDLLHSQVSSDETIFPMTPKTVNPPSPCYSLLLSWHLFLHGMYDT